MNALLNFRRIIALVVWLAASAPACLGFGADGHKIVGAIAEAYLGDAAKAEVQTLLGTQSLADSATWADDVRNNPHYFFAKPLHFINVPRTAASIDETRDCAAGECVTAAIRKYAAILRDRSKSPAERAEALKFVVHFVGDVHQPLHVSYADDQGGNFVKVSWLGAADWSLHSVWDSAIIKKRRGTRSWQQLAEDIRTHVGADERSHWKSVTDIATWANESLQITREVYADLPSDGKLGQAYYQKWAPRLDKQMAAAGVRLAQLLEANLGVPVVAEAITASSAPVTICSFNIQFLGQSSVRDNAALADLLKPYDLVVVQELIAPPYAGQFPNGAKFRPEPRAAKFFDAMKGQGFGYILSEEDTGKGATNHLNSTATEWWVTFFKSNRVDYATDLPHGFLSDKRFANPDFDRVPYAFGFRTKNRNSDFVLISVHLRPNSGKADRARRAHELGAIGQWINAHNSAEKDFIILGDMNIEDQADLANAMPSGLVSLNEKLEPTNTNVNGPKPYDHVMFNPGFTKEIDRQFGFHIIGLVERMKDYWGGPGSYPGDEPYQNDNVRKYYSAHDPVVFRITSDKPDDD